MWKRIQGAQKALDYLWREAPPRLARISHALIQDAGGHWDASRFHEADRNVTAVWMAVQRHRRLRATLAGG